MAQRCGYFTCVTYAKIPSCVMGAKLSCGGLLLLRQKSDVSAHLRISSLIVLYLDSIALPTFSCLASLHFLSKKHSIAR